MNPTPTFYALLVGIDTYDPRSRVPHLRGCVADVDHMARLLQERFGVLAANILRLTNAEATHQGIKTAFRQHLIDHARQAATAGADATTPAFLFHYSGHGSQALDESGSEPDGLDETLVPYDSRTPGVFDIKDWELGGLIEEINAFSDNVTIILDCCHSGSGTRDINLALTRRCPPDLRPQPLESQRPGHVGTAATKRAVGAGNWEIGGQHVLLAGCRDKEESNEYAVTAGGARYWQGAMSYFLQHELQQLPPDRTVTYRELFERVRHAVNQTYANQMPQCEGDIDRELFGGLRPDRDPFYTVIDRRDGLFWIDGGVAHGLTIGSELKVYAPETRTLTAAGEPLATLRVVDEGAVTSGCEPVEANTTVPLHGRCAIYRLHPGTMQRRVHVAITDPALRQAIEQRLQPIAPQGRGKQPSDVSPWLTVVSAAAPADFRVALVEEQLVIQDASGKALVAPFARTDLDGLAADLAHLARYENALALRNHAPSELTGTVTLAIKKLTFDPTTQAPLATAFERAAGGELVIESGDRVVIEVTNQSDQPLYFAIFDFAPDWAITQLYPTVQGAHEPLKAGGVFAFGLTNRRRGQLAAALPPGMAEAVERFKVIATVHETNFAVLQQKALKTFFKTRAVRGAGTDAAGQERPPSALDELLGQAINGNQRAFRVPPATVADEWTTAELSVLVIEPAAGMTQPITPGARTVLPAYGITVDAPAAFTGQIRVLTERQATRAATLAAATEPALPPGLAPHGMTFQPLPLGNRRSAMPLGTVVELEADDTARQAITAATPLTLHLDWPVEEGTERVIAVAYADGLFYPVGHSDADTQTVAITWLPSSDGATQMDEGDSEGQAADEALVMRRSVGRVLKLYLYKMVGWQAPMLGLHRVRYVEPAEIARIELAPGEFLREFAGGALLYGPIDADAILPRQRVAVAVHGFSADSLAIGIWLTNVFPKHGPAYDHVLAFDYESLATGVNENASTLADALHALELDVRPRVRVDLFAHSMGTLVTRAFVELWGGDAFVTRCFLAGPPNQGTRLADAKVLVPWLTSLALNSVGGWTPAAIAQWALGKIEANAAGVEDLRPSSPLLTALNQSTKTVLVSYFILAGHNPLLPQLDETLLERLQRHLLQGVDLALDTIFDDQNDLVINVRSMLGVRNGDYPAHLLQQAEVPCNHFTYFSEATAQAQLLRWLQ